jgi:uncharacterized protein (DUF486 family)
LLSERTDLKSFQEVILIIPYFLLSVFAIKEVKLEHYWMFSISSEINFRASFEEGLGLIAI